MDKKEKVKLIVISVICSVIVSVAVILLMSGNISSLSIKDFNISKVKYSTENLYSDTIYYNGSTKITCKDKKGTYLVIYSEKLVSGGTYEKIGKTNYYTVIVHNGEGIITTYDYGDKDEIAQPVYEIELLGYRSFY